MFHLPRFVHVVDDDSDLVDVAVLEEGGESKKSGIGSDARALDRHLHRLPFHLLSRWLVDDLIDCVASCC